MINALLSRTLDGYGVYFLRASRPLIFLSMTSSSSGDSGVISSSACDLVLARSAFCLVVSVEAITSWCSIWLPAV